MNNHQQHRHHNNLLTSSVNDIDEQQDSLDNTYPDLADENNPHSISSDQEDVEAYTMGGYHRVCLGDVIKNRYYVIRKLGWGQFCTVWLAWDLRNLNFVALKIVKSALQYMEAAVDEVAILKRIQDAVTADPAGKRVIRLLDHFRIRGVHGTHMCMVYPVLGHSLFDLVVHSNYTGMALAHVKLIVRQILEGLDFLHVTCGIIHCDIKPENVLLAACNDEITKLGLEAFAIQKCNEDDKFPLPASFICSVDAQKKNKQKISCADSAKYTKREKLPLIPSQQSSSCLKISKETKFNSYLAEFVRNHQETVDERELPSVTEPYSSDSPNVVIADFGNACCIESYCSSDLIQTRQYRSLEVLIGASYGPTADIWSVACLTYELVTGRYLFNCHVNNNAITSMESHVALISSLLGPIPKHVALSGLFSDGPFTPDGELKRELQLPDEVSLENRIKQEGPRHLGNAEINDLAEFLRFMLHLDQSKRPTAKQCLAHQWLQ